MSQRSSNRAPAPGRPATTPLPAGAAQRPARGRPRGALRQSLARVIASGLSGCAEQLAAHTGWPPEAVRRTLWEMARAGEAQNLARPAPGRFGRAPGVFAQAADASASPAAVDALAFARSVWR